MKPDSTSYENILEVENWGSQLSTFYKIMSPVQITLESCTGLGETDQYSIQMFSPNGCWLHENSMDALFRALSSRPLHRHDYFELMLVLEGEVIQQIEEKEYPYRAGTCCLVNRSILHNERFIGPAKLCFIGLSVDFVRSLTESAPLQLFEAERHLPENPVLQFMLANLCRCKQLGGCSLPVSHTFDVLSCCPQVVRHSLDFSFLCGFFIFKCPNAVFFPQMQRSIVHITTCQQDVGSLAHAFALHDPACICHTHKTCRA